MICVNSVTAHPSSITIKKGEWNTEAYVTVTPSNATNKSVTWSSENSSIASVNYTTGYIHGNNVGTTKIYATAVDGSGKRGCITVTVEKVYVETLSLDKTELSLEKGETYSLLATVLPLNAETRALYWTSSNYDVADVSAACGLVTAKAKGTAIITAHAQDGSGKIASCTVNVTDILVKSIVVNSPVDELKVGESAFFTATVSPENAENKNVTWSSSNPSVLSVNENSGLVIANAPGDAVIYATAQDGSGVTGSYSVYVNAPVMVESIVVEPSSLILNKCQQYQLSAFACPVDADNKDISWSSSDPSVATVDQNGLVTCISSGVAEIRATSKDGSNVIGSCTIKVRETIICSEEEKPESKVDGSKVADPVDVYSGAHTIKNTIMTLFGGQDLKFEANYNSIKLVAGSMGKGWYHNYEKAVVINGTEAYVYSSPSNYARYVALDEAHTVFACVSMDKNGYILTIDNTSEYPYILNCNSDHIEYYDMYGDLCKIVNHQGFETIIENQHYSTTITDAITGKKIYLEKDSEGKKITRVYDDANRQAILSYQDDKLVSICDLNGNTLTFTYDEDGRALTGTDGKNTCYFTNIYDDFGRVSSQSDGRVGSISSIFVYDGQRRLVTDRNGNQSIRVFDSNGLLVSHTDENGNTKTYEYDDRYNVIKETDAKGNFITKTFNDFNKPLEITDKNGNKTCYEYDLKGNLTKIVYPAINEISAEETFEYNERNQLTRHVDTRGTATVCTYDTLSLPSTKKVGEKPAINYLYQNGYLVSQTDALGNVTLYAYNAVGQIASTTNADNKVTSFEYDAVGNVTKITDANGKTIINVYDCNNQKISVTDANGNVTQYFYNGNLKNDTVAFADGNAISYEFDGEDRVVRITDQNFNATTIQYDKGGRVISKTFADGGIIQYEYDTVGNVIKETNQKGAITTKTYDAMGNVLTVTDDDGNVSRYQYDARSRLVRFVNAMSGATIYEYSQAGDLLSETDALGNKKTYTYDAYGNRLTFTDAKNNTTTYTYDANDNLLTAKDALNNVTTCTYDALNRLASVKDAKNNVTRFSYDSLGRCVTTTDAKNNVFTTVYDANGNKTKIIDAKGNTVSETEYNCLNLPTKITDAVGKSITYTYNKLGKVETVVDSMNQTTTFSYNEVGLNTSVSDALNNVSRTNYDLLGNIVKLEGPLGGSTSYTYDKMGKLIAQTTTSPDASISYTYNALNIKNKVTNARGQIINYSHDTLGRITGYTSIEDSVSFTYDANGNVLTVTDKNGTVTREYDALNRVTKYTDTYGKEICYEYDAVGNLVKLTYPDGTSVHYAYDANRNLVSVTDWSNRSTTYSYDDNNKLIGVTKPDGSITTTVYDNKNRIVSTVERTPLDVIITGFEYTYDSLDRLIEEKHLDNNIKMCYTYDELSRVTKRTTKDLEDTVLLEETFSYDAAGNITADTSNVSKQYDINNRLSTYGAQPVTYDLDGNMLSVQIGEALNSFGYDSQNRLVSVGNRTYTYNAENVRIRNLCGEDDTTYTYNTNCRLSQLLQKTTNGVTTKYVYGHGLIGEETNSVFKTYHFDFRGSTIAITDASGNITDTFKYDTYGKLLSRTGTSEIIFGYNGRDGVITEPNGLIYMRARYYYPELKRFVNADIIAGDISNAVTLNRYAYANGNPVSFIDPFGLSADRGGLSKNVYNNLMKYLVDTISASSKFSSNQWKTGKVMVGNTTFYCEIESTVGNGELNLTEIAQGHAKLVAETDFSNAKVEAIAGSDISIGMKLSHKVDNNYISAVVQIKNTGIVNVEYSVKSQFEQGSITSKVGAEFRNNENKKDQTQPEGVKEPSVMQKIGQSLKNAGEAIGDFFRDTGEAIGDFFRDTGEAIGDHFEQNKEFYFTLAIGFMAVACFGLLACCA